MLVREGNQLNIQMQGFFVDVPLAHVFGASEAIGGERVKTEGDLAFICFHNRALKKNQKTIGQ